MMSNQPLDFEPNFSAHQNPILERLDKPEEACGVFGVYAPEENVARLAYFGLYALQHRGQESAGIATFEGDKVHCHKDMGLVSQVFNEAILQRLPGTMAVGHTRYSTTGSSLRKNAQPAIVKTQLGSLALAHNGNLVNAVELRERLIDRAADFTTTTDSEAIALAIAEEVNLHQDWLQGTISALKLCSGAYSLTIATPEGVMGVRDPNGIRPLVIGILAGEDERPNRYVLASETCGLDIIGAEYLRDVEPGELVWITEAGLASVHWAEKPERKLCIFEMIYFARPDSVMHDETLYSYRLRLGAQLVARISSSSRFSYGGSRLWYSCGDRFFSCFWYSLWRRLDQKSLCRSNFYSTYPKYAGIGHPHETQSPQRCLNWKTDRNRRRFDRPRYY